MKTPLLDAAARLLRGSEPAVPLDALGRADAIALMTAARDRAERRRRAGRVAIASFALAAAVLLSIGVARVHRVEATKSAASVASSAPPVDTTIVHALSGTAAVLRAGKEIPILGRIDVEPGDRVIAGADGRAGVTLTTGTQLLVENAGDVALLGTTSNQVLFLAAGALRADVAKLSPGARFVVRTADAEVEVRGTSFRVERRSGCAESATLVTVFEGVVSVRAGGEEHRLIAGTRWPSQCTAEGAAGQPSPSAIATPSAKVYVPTSAASPAPSIVAQPSQLAEQNDLYAAALAARRRGDAPAAVAKFDDLLKKYPGSALAEQAMVARFKALATFDATRARAAAAAYLAKYPNGYARNEAQVLAGTTP